MASAGISVSSVGIPASSAGMFASSAGISVSPTGISARQSLHADILVLVQEPCSRTHDIRRSMDYLKKVSLWL